ncbi:MAG: DMT family transporter [Hyphomicrobiaceae bacterium]|nr:DMT family transporter [Hyphomicrobiaceae bacterium]
MSKPHPGAMDYALLLALGAIWGSSFLIIKLAVATVPAATTTAARLAIAAVIMYAVARHAGQHLPRDPKVWRLILLSALFGFALPFFLIGWGEEEIDSGLAAILMGAMPLTTVLLAHILTDDEKLNLRKGAGVTLGLVGLVVLIGPEKLATLGDNTVRQLAVTAAGACYGVNAIITKSLISQPRRALVASVMLAATAMTIPISLFIDRPWSLDASGLSVASVLLLGVLPTAYATLLMFKLVDRQGASFFSQINFLTPLFGVFLGAFILAERPPPNAYVALAIILLGVAVARGRKPAS